MLQEDGKAVWELIRQVTKFNPSDRKYVKDLLGDQYFSKDKEKKKMFDLYNSPSPDGKPGLCVIISQGKHHNVICYISIKTCFYIIIKLN